jgi:ligand-binding SRPBCC domain-containing protein
VPRDLDELFAAFSIVETIATDAPPERVWALVTDVRRMPEFSPECVEVSWLDGAGETATGARFAGASRAGAFEWTRNCTITECRAPSVFAYDVYDHADVAPQSRWRFEVTSDGDRTVLTQRFAHVPDGRSTVRLMAEDDPATAQETIDERADMLRAAMRRTLEAMRDELEAT